MRMMTISHLSNFTKFIHKSYMTLLSKSTQSNFIFNHHATFTRKQIINYQSPSHMSKGKKIPKNLQKLSNNNSGYSVIPEDLDRYLDNYPNKKSIIQRIVDYRSKYPSPESMLQDILLDKKKTNPKSTLDDITNEDLENFMDPVIIAIDKDFMEWKSKNSSAKSLEIAESNKDLDIDKDDTYYKMEENKNLSSQVDNPSLALNTNMGTINIPMSMEQMDNRFNEDTNDIKKIKENIFKVTPINKNDAHQVKKENKKKNKKRNK